MISMNTQPLDLYPGPISPELAEAHQHLDVFFKDMQDVDAYRLKPAALKRTSSYQAIAGLPAAGQVKVIRAAVERMRWSAVECVRPGSRGGGISLKYLAENTPQHFMLLIQRLLAVLCAKRLPVEEPDLLHLVSLLRKPLPTPNLQVRPADTEWHVAKPVLHLLRAFQKDHPISEQLGIEVLQLVAFLRDPSSIIDMRENSCAECAREFEKCATSGSGDRSKPAHGSGAFIPSRSPTTSSVPCKQNQEPCSGNLLPLKFFIGLGFSRTSESVQLEGPDRFPLRSDSGLRDEHALLSRFLVDMPGVDKTGEPDFDGSAVGKEILSRVATDEGRCLVATAERVSSAYIAPVLPLTDPLSVYYARVECSRMLRILLDKKPLVARPHLFDLLLLLGAAPGILGSGDSSALNHLILLVEQLAEKGPLTAGEVSILERLRAESINIPPFGRLPALASRLTRLIHDSPVFALVPGEAWSDCLNENLGRMENAIRGAWLGLLQHLGTAGGSRPSAKWLAEAHGRLAAIGEEQFHKLTLEVFTQLDKGRSLLRLDTSLDTKCAVNQLLHPDNANCLRGWLWVCPLSMSPALVRAIGQVALSSYRKVQGVGPRAVKVGNAAVYALSEIASADAVGQLAMLKARVKFGSALKEIEKAFVATAKRLGLPVDEIEEMSVPAYGLTEVGRCTEVMGEFTAQLTVTGGGTELVWLKPDGKLQKSIAASVKAEHAEELKELQGAAKDIQRMLPAQRERIDTLFLQQKAWPLAVWRERYLDHPLVGVIARRLLWEFTTGQETTTGIWFNPARSSGRESAPSSSAEDQSRLTSAATQIVDLDLRPIAHLGAETTVRLWHPIGKDPEEVLAWRAWLDEQQIQQPFKQAHREVYLLADAERQTRTYSNRYAAHVLRQHQFNALCAARGWKNKLRLLVDAEFPPATLYLPKWNLRAEFWIEGAGDNYGTDTNETGTFLYLTTDQVRFYRHAVAADVSPLHLSQQGIRADSRPRLQENEPAEPLSLEEIPPLVFSEVMRDVDLFVGVASVGNDPNWADGGPAGRYQAYWQSYSFGDLSATAKTRREVLTRLLPRLKIAAQCTLADKFLVVEGSLRTYKIHLGSGNILMEPNDQYLCIVPAQSADAGKDRVFLPFEGDTTLSVILSKAFLLADDAKIKDPTIVSQIKRT